MKTKSLLIRLTDEQKETIETYCKENSIKMGPWIVKVIINRIKVEERMKMEG